MNNNRKQFIALLSGQLLYLLLNFALPLVLVRILSVDDYGIYAQFNTITTLFVVVLSFSISSELYYYFPRLEKQDSNKATLIYQSLILLLAASILSILILNIPLIKHYIADFGQIYAFYTYIVIFIAISIPEVLTTNLYVLNNNHKLSAIYLPISAFLRLGLIIGYYYIYNTIQSIFIALIISAVIKFFFAVIYSITIAKGYGNFHFSFNTLKSQIGYCLPLGLAQSFKTIGSQIDKFILLIFITPSQYAIYSIAFYGVPGITQIYLAISQTYVPRMVKAYKYDGTTAMVDIYRSMISKTISYTFPTIAIFSLMAGRIIPIVFSEKYVDSVFYFRVYLLTFMFTCLGAGNLMRAVNKTRYIMYIYLLVTICAIPITYYSINLFGMVGAIMSAAASIILPVILLLNLDAYYSNTSIFKLIPWKNVYYVILATFVSIICLLFVETFVEDIGVPYLILIIIMAFIICFGIELLFDVFIITRQEFKSYIYKILKISYE